MLAIGSLFGLSETVTAGIVSAKNRSIDEPGPDGRSNQFQKFIQTDAAINPGKNPAARWSIWLRPNYRHEYRHLHAVHGLAGRRLRNAVQHHRQHLQHAHQPFNHKVVRGSIGISFQGAIPAAASREYGFADGGVLVSTVTPNGPAAKGGLKPFDVIVSIDGKSIKDGDALVADISARKVGSTVQLGVLRNGTKQNVTVGIADRAKLFADTGNPNDDNSAPSESDAGDGALSASTVSALPSALSSKLGVKGGIIVNSVRPGSFADDEINPGEGHCHHRDQQTGHHRPGFVPVHRCEAEIR